jgi:predicted metal-dependent hydrolase
MGLLKPVAARRARALLPEYLECEGMVVEVRRNSRRRSRIAIVVDPGGVVVLDVPPATGREEIETLIREHRRWLQRRLAEAQARPTVSARIQFEAGALVPYRGQRYVLRLRDSPHAPAQLTDDSLYLGVASHAPEEIAGRLRRWYRRQATCEFHRAMQARCDLPWLGGDIPVWRHRYMRSQWGSCAPDGLIALNTQLIKVPPPVLDLVVLHELCHLVERRHCARFYALMDRHLPEHRRLGRELDQYTPVLLHDC